jgi:hypothetical protein
MLFLHSAPFHISKTTPKYKTKVMIAITAQAMPKVVSLANGICGKPKQSAIN